MERPTAPGKRAGRCARRPAPAPSDSLPGESIARNYSSRTAWLVVALVVLAGLVSVGVSLAASGGVAGAGAAAGDRDGAPDLQLEMIVTDALGRRLELAAAAGSQSSRWCRR